LKNSYGTLKIKPNQQKVTIGSWITLAHPAIAEIMAKAGFDWLTFDMEHSVITIREAQHEQHTGNNIFVWQGISSDFERSARKRF